MPSTCAVASTSAMSSTSMRHCFLMAAIVLPSSLSSATSCASITDRVG